jgi:hypothetical protein
VQVYGETCSNQRTGPHFRLEIIESAQVLDRLERSYKCLCLLCVCVTDTI